MLMSPLLVYRVSGVMVGVKRCDEFPVAHYCRGTLGVCARRVKARVALGAVAKCEHDTMRVDHFTRSRMAAEVLPSIELETAPNPTASVIWLHGLGADGNDFVPIVPELGLPPAAAVRFVFPHAPVRSVTINNGMRMRAWYDIAAADLNNRADITGVRQSQGEIEALITREKARGVPAARIVLAGF